MARHIECRFGERVVSTRENLPEGPNCVLQWDKLALVASEDLSNLERLRYEMLNLAGTLSLEVMK